MKIKAIAKGLLTLQAPIRLLFFLKVSAVLRLQYLCFFGS